MNADFARASAVVLATIVLTLGAHVSVAKDVKLSLTGSEETPPVTTSANGTGTLKVAKDKSVSGAIKTSGIEGTAAHIHVGAQGQSGPPIITLVKGTDGTWSVPAGSKLTDEHAAIGHQLIQRVKVLDVACDYRPTEFARLKIYESVIRDDAGRPPYPTFDRKNKHNRSGELGRMKAPELRPAPAHAS